MILNVFCSAATLTTGHGSMNTGVVRSLSALYTLFVGCAEAASKVFFTNKPWGRQSQKYFLQGNIGKKVTSVLIFVQVDNT